MSKERAKDKKNKFPIHQTNPHHDVDIQQSERIQSNIKDWQKQWD